MKKTPIYLALATACVALGATGAQLHQLTLPSQAISQLKSRQQADNLKQNKGLNIALTPSRKFSPEAGLTGSHRYIIRLKDKPLSQYGGELQGYGSALVSSRSGEQKLDLKGTAASRYKALLEQKQSHFISSASKLGVSVSPQAQFQLAINGMVAQLSQAQAQRLAELPEVAHIERVQMRQLLSDTGAKHIGAGDVWAGNTASGVGYLGDGMVVGIIDTGVNSDHPSFADTGADGVKIANPLGSGHYLHDCTKAGFEDRCNDKLIGIWSTPIITDTFQDPYFAEGRPAIGEDYNGHGSHTASTAVGNVLDAVPLQLASVGNGDGVDTGFTFERLSGMAPHANLITYQVCYPGNSGDLYAGCPTDALVAGIEQAIEDGVDVINFSIGGSEKFPWEDSVELAFLSARQAGVSVAAAAGNSGGDGWQEYYGSADHSSPWLATVGATTIPDGILVHDRYLKDLSGGDTTAPANLQGLGITDAFTGNIVYAGDFGDALCLASFPAGTFSSDQIVVCDRGDNARVEKADNIKAGGAGGFILVDVSPDTTPVNDVYSLPGIHLGISEGEQLKTWLASGSGHSGTIEAALIEETYDPSAGDQLAYFSSRGPANTHGDYLIPDLAAPGVDIYAAYADEHPFSESPVSSDWSYLSGTSMASPHVAGAMALLKQAHPDWSDAEVLSALMMTAEQVWWKGEKANLWQAGAGRINVAKAIDTGLVMDVPVDDFMAANPHNGGDVKALNLPSMVNSQCLGTCSWLRTFTATRDGTWELATDTGELSYVLDVHPKQFSLQAGQTQTVMVTASILDAQTPLGNSEFFLDGQLTLTPSDAALPALHLPVQAKFSHGRLPEAMQVPVNRNKGQFGINHLTLPATDSLDGEVTALVKPAIETLTLKQDSNYELWDDITDGTSLRILEVPANTARLIVESLGLVESSIEEPYKQGSLTVVIGKDINGDGLPQFDTEAICLSNASTINNYCNINEPSAGNYWVVLNNYANALPYGETATDSFKVATAIVSKDVATDASLSVPASTDGVNPATVTLNWALDDFSEGDFRYAMLSLGHQGSKDNLGLIPLKVVREADDVSFKVSKTKAKPGDVIDFSVKVTPNIQGLDRQFSLGLALPEGLTLLPDSVALGTLGDQELVVDGNSISLSGVQPNTADLLPRYQTSTSLTDAQCRTPDINSDTDGGYKDLASYGVSPLPLWDGGYTAEAPLDLSWIWYDLAANEGVSLYHNQAYSRTQTVTINPAGFIDLEGLPLFWPFHYPLPFDGFPYSVIAPLWRGLFAVDYSPSFGDALAGISVAGLTHSDNSKTLIVEWDNVYTQTIDGSTPNDSFDFEAFINLDYKFEKGQPEIIFAYGKLDGQLAGVAGFPANIGGSVGVKGFQGPLDAFGPIYGYLGTQVAYDESLNQIQEGVVVCLDYRGPEESQMSLSFQARVNESAIGQDMALTLENQVEGLDDDNKTAMLSVATNIQIAPMADLSTEENTAIEGIEVLYVDNLGGDNSISVTGKHISATVHGHGPGATFDLVPEANFHGQTLVTVTVADQAAPNDKASTSFMLTVNSDGVDPVEPQPTPDADNGGGGGALGFGLALLALLGWRRRA
ncbi:S8 family serine peptidase [Gallaecimonas xiamenensis]|uniref:Serine protease n=1 Tax=Gallaecimonas xiamenensis 3-C-1 TaxID=745411 RepID=K2K1P9_9GAMM|nr:S8 family serine peptidase [Gallaecimonas xiamenensis]EKE76734.1 serine protease [Gallaecimonas xiamenensis 3-C-1]